MHQVMATGMLLAIALGSAAESAVAEAQLLAGRWIATEAERDGARALDLVGHVLSFAGDRFEITKHGALLYAGTFSVDPSAQPARIDFVQDAGAASGQRWAGIYSVEGARLQIADNAPDPEAPRPTSFVTTKGSGHVMLVFQR